MIKRQVYLILFFKVFIDLDNGVDLHNDCLLSSTKHKQDIEITTAIVGKALDRLNTSMSQSPDHIPIF